jgi:hypothetical protein
VCSTPTIAIGTPLIWVAYFASRARASQVIHPPMYQIRNDGWSPSFPVAPPYDCFMMYLQVLTFDCNTYIANPGSTSNLQAHNKRLVLWNKQFVDRRAASTSPHLCFNDHQRPGATQPTTVWRKRSGRCKCERVIARMLLVHFRLRRK